MVQDTGESPGQLQHTGVGTGILVDRGRGSEKLVIIVYGRLCALNIK